jgi:hypothetical protein
VPPLYGAFFVKRFQSGASFFLDRFLCSTRSLVSSPRTAWCGRDDVQRGARFRARINQISRAGKSVRLRSSRT